MQVNEIYFVGSNKYGQSGTGQKNNTKMFQTIKNYDFGIFVKQVSCGYHHSAILTISGYVYTMGSNIHGTLGSRQEGLNYSFYPILVQNIPTINKIQSGSFHLCALSCQGEVYSWGRGMDGQLGNGSNKNYNLPQRIDIQEEIIDLSCGTNHTIILTASQQAYAFGNGIYGQLGTGNNKNQLRPKKINLQNVTMVSAGQNHSLYLCNDTIYATGDNTSGQIGIGNTKKYVLQPQKINLSNASIVRAAKFSAAIASGELYVWGGPSKKYIPYLVQSDFVFSQLKCGNQTLMVLSSKGGLYSWNVSQNTGQQEVLKDVEVNSNAVLDFSIGENHTMILGDIYRTVLEDQMQTPPKILRYYDSTEGLRDITHKTNISTNIQVKNKQSIDYHQKGRNDYNRIQRNQQKQRAKREPTNNIINTISNTRDNSIQQKLQQLVSQTRVCKRQFQQVKELIQQAKRVSVDPQKNKSFFSTRSKQNSSISFNSEKNNIVLLREKDLKISQLQQQLSKKQVLMDVYENTVSTLTKVIETQKEQISLFETYFKK